MVSQGLRVLRFTNRQILSAIDKVLEDYNASPVRPCEKRRRRRRVETGDT